MGKGMVQDLLGNLADLLETSFHLFSFEKKVIRRQRKAVFHEEN